MDCPSSAQNRNNANPGKKKDASNGQWGYGGSMEQRCEKEKGNAAIQDHVPGG